MSSLRLKVFDKRDISFAKPNSIERIISLDYQTLNVMLNKTLRACLIC